jgi:hypothetical protein
MVNYGMFVFDEKKLREQIGRCEYAPLQLHPDELRYTVTQNIDGKEYTLHFVVRDGYMFFYNPSDQRL